MSEPSIDAVVIYNLSGLLHIDLEVIAIALEEFDGAGDPDLVVARDTLIKVIDELM